jgi:hypothetical protein
MSDKLIGLITFSISHIHSFMQGFRRHQKFCQGTTNPAVSSVGEVTVAKVEAIEAVAEPELEVMAPADPLGSDMMDSALREKMKGGPLTREVFGLTPYNIFTWYDMKQ